MNLPFEKELADDLVSDSVGVFCKVACSLKVIFFEVVSVSSLLLDVVVVASVDVKKTNVCVLSLISVDSLENGLNPLNKLVRVVPRLLVAFHFVPLSVDNKKDVVPVN